MNVGAVETKNPDIANIGYTASTFIIIPQQLSTLPNMNESMNDNNVVTNPDLPQIQSPNSVLNESLGDVWVESVDLSVGVSESPVKSENSTILNFPSFRIQQNAHV
jgi:hypothetical protein